MNGYQAEALLLEFRKRYGFQKKPVFKVDQLELSAEARQESQRVHHHYEKPAQNSRWLTPRDILSVIHQDNTDDPLVNYIQQLRAGRLLNPPYQPDPPISIGKVHDYLEEFAKQAGSPPDSQKETQQENSNEATSESSQQPSEPSKPFKPSQTPQPDLESKAEHGGDTAPETPKQTQHAVANLEEVLEKIEEEEDDVFADLGERVQNADETDSDVINGTGRITEYSTIKFIQENPASAIKFLFQRELDEKRVSPQIEELYAQWSERGLSRKAIKGYILSLMDWEGLPSNNVNDIYQKVRDQIFELKDA